MRWKSIAEGATAVGEAAASSAAPADRARQILEALRCTVPFDCAALATLRGGGLELLGELDAPAGMQSALRLPEYRAEHAKLGMLRRSVPLRFADLPAGGAATFTARELAWPAGLRGGVGMALFARDGREVGFLSCNTEGAAGLTPEHRDTVGLLAGVLGEVADVAGMLAARYRGAALLESDGRLEPVPGGRLPDDPDLIRAVRSIAGAMEPAIPFLHPTARRDRWWHVRLEPTLAEDRRMVHLREVRAPYGLTARELEVLTLLTRGDTNTEISRALVVARGTVRTHVEHVLAKLGAASRTEAAVIAATEGLRIRQLTY